MNIFTMLNNSRDSKKLTIGNVIKVSNYNSSVLHTELRVSTLVLFIVTAPKQMPDTIFITFLFVKKYFISCMSETYKNTNFLLVHIILQCIDKPQFKFYRH